MRKSLTGLVIFFSLLFNSHSNAQSLKLASAYQPDLTYQQRYNFNLREKREIKRTTFEHKDFFSEQGRNKSIDSESKKEVRKYGKVLFNEWMGKDKSFEILRIPNELYNEDNKLDLDFKPDSITLNKPFFNIDISSRLNISGIKTEVSYNLPFNLSSKVGTKWDKFSEFRVYTSLAIPIDKSTNFSLISNSNGDKSNIMARITIMW